jgi:hypothetical protein
MRTTFTLLFCFFLIFSLAHAQHKCTIDGKTSYQDRPCEQGAKATVITTKDPIGGTTAKRIELKETAKQPVMQLPEKEKLPIDPKVVTATSEVGPWGKVGVKGALNVKERRFAQTNLPHDWDAAIAKFGWPDEWSKIGACCGDGAGVTFLASWAPHSDDYQTRTYMWFSGWSHMRLLKLERKIER